MRRILFLPVIILSFWLLSIPVSAQLSAGGAPAGKAAVAIMPAVPVITLSAPDPIAIAEQDASEPVPYRFAVMVPCETDVVRKGSWQTQPDGSSICVLAVEAPGAKALSLFFDSFYIPAGGKLFIYNEKTGQMLGAFTSANNNTAGTFSTQLIHGDRLIVEYDQPAGAVMTPGLRISRVAWAYRGVREPGATRGFGGADSCEVNVNCWEEGHDYQVARKGIVRIQVARNGSLFWCSGSLINNTRFDGTPYVISADHCYKNATADDLQNWVFYFGYEAPGCENPVLPPQEKALTGATLKARAGDVYLGGSDFLLLLLNDTIPDTFDVYLNGWDRSGLSVSSGVDMHHPQGDIKKISTFTNPLVTTHWVPGGGDTHWEVIWSGTPNGHGVTEPGSSGSALFDSTGLIIGTETGGGASCDSLDLSEPDYFGKISYSWASNGNSPSGQLKPWLDPDNTGEEKIGGRPLAVETPVPSATLSVFPNPARDKLTVTIKGWGVKNSFQVTLFDGRGVPVLSESRSFITHRETFDLPPLSTGLYLLRVSGPTGTMVQKIVIQ